MEIKYEKIIQALIFLACLFLALQFTVSARYIFSLKGIKISPLFMYSFLSVLIFFVMFINEVKISQIKGTALFAAFVVYILITLLWTPTPVYGTTKIVHLVAFTAFFIGASVYILREFEKFIFYFFIVTIISIILIYFEFGSPLNLVASIAFNGRLGSEALNPIYIARYLGFANICLLLLIMKKKSNLFRTGLAALLIISSLYMVFTGSKGPLVGFIMASTFILYFNTKELKYKILYLAAGGAVILVIFIFLNLGGQTVQRFLAARFTHNVSSYSVRDKLYSGILGAYANLNIPHLFFGVGSGGYAHFYLGLDQRAYPHNILLEILYEYGVVGLVLSIVTLTGPVYLVIKNKGKEPLAIALLAMWGYWFVNSMLSGDIGNNFFLFGTSILLMVLNFVNNEYTREEGMDFGIRHRISN